MVCSRIRGTRWKFIIAGLIGTGICLSIWTMSPGGPGSLEDKSSRSYKRVGSKSSRLVESLGRNVDYCTIRNCRTVTCSLISESLNPGRIASDFISQTFKSQCSNSSVISELTFESCIFPNNRLERDWLSVDLVPIEKLAFRNCPLEEFAEGCFAKTIFAANLESLELATGNVRRLRKHVFDELRSLKILHIEDNAVIEAEYDLLNSVADSLEILVLDGCLGSVRVLANITSGRRNLRKVQIFSIQRNVLASIIPEIFHSLGNVVSVYLGNSMVQTFHVDSFESTGALKLLDVKNNLLTKLPFGIFESVITRNPDFRITMTENPWDCSCDFQWMGELVRHNPGILTEVPKCQTPERNSLLEFGSAEFCENATETTITDITNEAGNEESNYVIFTCKSYESFEPFNESEMSAGPRTTRRLSSVEEWKLPSRFRDFSAIPFENSSILINLTTNGNPVFVIWFKNLGHESEVNHENSIGRIDCARNVRGPFVVRNLERGATYTICLLENIEKWNSPLNCLAAATATVRTMTGRFDELKNDVWLRNADKPVAISISTSIFVFVGLSSALASFFVIRRNPSLLRGSERIVIVKKRGIDALIIPRGIVVNGEPRENEKITIDEKERCEFRKNNEQLYVTPLNGQQSLYDCEHSSPREGPAGRKASRISSQASYIEANPSEVYSCWRNNARTKSPWLACSEKYEFEKTPPAIPPLPSRSFLDPSIPSLSLAVDCQNRPRHDH